LPTKGLQPVFGGA